MTELARNLQQPKEYKPYRIIYTRPVPIDTFVAAASEVRESYLGYLIRIGICEPQAVADSFGVTVAMAWNLLESYDLFLKDQEIVASGKVQREFEDKLLERYQGRKPIKVSLQHAFLKVINGAVSGPGAFEMAIEAAVTSAISRLSSKTDGKEEKGEKLMSESLRIINSSPVNIETVLGKPFAKMNSADIKTVATGCPIEPIHDRKKALKDPEFFRAVKTYFPVINSKDVSEYLFGKCETDSAVSKLIAKLGFKYRPYKISYGYIYSMAAFILWATGDEDRANFFVKTKVEQYRTVLSKKSSKKSKSSKKAGKTTIKEPPVEIASPMQTTTTVPAVSLPPAPVSEEPVDKPNANVRIDFDVSDGNFAEAVASLYLDYPGLIVQFEHRGETAFAVLNKTAPNFGGIIGSFISRYISAIISYRKE